MSAPPQPKNLGKLIGFMYVTTRPDGKYDIETVHACPPEERIARNALFDAMISALEKEKLR